MSFEMGEARRWQASGKDGRPGLTQARLSSFMETEHDSLGCRKRRR